jgi:hypothetical protein
MTVRLAGLLMIALLTAAWLQGPSAPKPLDVTVELSAQTEPGDTLGVFQGSWKRPGLPNNWNVSFIWMTEGRDTLTTDTTMLRTFQQEGTVATQYVEFTIPLLWEPIVANFCVSTYVAERARMSEGVCVGYNVPARPLPPPDSVLVEPVQLPPVVVDTIP